MNTEVLVRFLKKELLGYKNNLVFIQELQNSLLTLSDQFENRESNTKLVNLINNLENKLEEIRYTVNPDLVFNQSIIAIEEFEITLNKILSSN